MKYRLTKINPMDLGLLFAFVYFFGVVIYFLVFTVLSLLDTEYQSFFAGMAIEMLLFIFLYGIAGYFSGLILGFFYNLFVRLVGGIEIELEKIERLGKDREESSE